MVATRIRSPGCTQLFLQEEHRELESPPPSIQSSRSRVRPRNSREQVELQIINPIRQYICPQEYTQNMQRGDFTILSGDIREASRSLHRC
jgi:hypothetical protein